MGCLLFSIKRYNVKIQKPDNEKWKSWEGKTMLALKVLPGVPKDDVVDDLIRQIVSAIDDLDESVHE